MHEHVLDYHNQKLQLFFLLLNLRLHLIHKTFSYLSPGIYLSKIIFDIEKTAKEANEDYQETIDLLKEKINFINENFIKKYDQEYYNQVNALLNNYYKVDQDGIPLYKKFIQDINNEGFYLDRGL